MENLGQHRASNHPLAPKGRRRAAGAFTLLEVVLAIVIAAGILAVAMTFYHQAANLRTQLIEETEKISTARLLLERLAAELRTSIPGGVKSLTGDSNSLHFVKTDLAPRTAWLGAPLGRTLAPQTDLKRIAYRLSMIDLTNVAGLIRSEEPLVQTRRILASSHVLAIDTVDATNRAPALLTDKIRWLQFRYWDGAAWQDAWTHPDLPLGIEVSLGPDPVDPFTEFQDDPPEIFRRVIYLPASSASLMPLPSSATSDSPSDQEEPL